MEPVTIEDRKKELRILLEQIEAAPSRDWSRERERIVVLQQMIAANGKQPSHA
jgi:hypothetical protein